MRISLLRPQAMGPELLAAWSRLQEAEPTLDSPYFRPEFTQAVAAVRDDVEVAVLDRQGEPIGFFPFQRGAFGIGRPIGGHLCDFQGPVVRSGVAWRAEELVRACRLRTWLFDHGLAAQAPLAAHATASATSPYMDLSQGFEAYRAARRQAGSDKLVHVGRKLRKIGREVGPVRFEFQTSAPEAWAALVEWKTDQYRRSKAADALAAPWVLALLQRILGQRDPAFAGVLSALFVDGRVAAVHLGMRSFGVLHWWFPAYDPALHRYSPGLLLLTKLAEACPDLGIRRIDLGKGSEPYKASFMSGAAALCEGSVDCGWPVKTTVQGLRQMRQWIRSSPVLYPAARRLAYTLSRLKAHGGSPAADGSA